MEDQLEPITFDDICIYILFGILLPSPPPFPSVDYTTDYFGSIITMLHTFN